MKKVYILFVLIGFFSANAKAQLTGMTPNQGMQLQTLVTTITSNGLFIQASSPGGNIYQINLKQGGYTIPVFEYWMWSGTMVIDPNTVETIVTIPLAAPQGLYNLEVITGDEFDPTWNHVVHTLPDAFTVSPPDGYITGKVFHDLNENGVYDLGEPGVQNRTIRLLPQFIQLTTNASGDYSFPVLNGNYSVTLQNTTNPFMFLTSAEDTFAVTINNTNADNNDFGLKNTLYSVTPPTGYKGLTTVHQIKADEPIFITGGNPNGNVSGFSVMSSPIINITAASNVVIIDPYTINVSITVPIGAPVQNNIDIRVNLNSGFTGSHFLRQQFNIEVPAAIVSGTLFFDQNQNKVFDAGEPGIFGGKVSLMPENSISFSSSNGQFQVGSNGGVQVLTYENNLPDLVLFTDSTSYTYNLTGNVSGQNFGFISTAPNYSITAHGINVLPRCNTNQYVSFKVKNISNIAYNARPWLKFDPLMNFVSSPNTPFTISNDTIYWTVSNLQPMQEIVIQAFFSLPGAGNVITIVAGAHSLDGGGNIMLTSVYESQFTIICAWDPNDKQVTPPGIFSQNYTLMSDTLLYLIRFQNTGNDTAFKVVVLDTLDSNFDYNTLEILDASHEMITQLKQNGALSFTFNDIMLVDSVANEPDSHGYILYRIRALSGLPDETPVYNTAHIFFDFNPAVVTNTTMNTLVYVLPVGLNEPVRQDEVLLYPNPFSQITTLVFDNPSHATHTLTITDITGKRVQYTRNTTGNMFVIEKNNLEKGMYVYQLINTVTGKINSGKMLVD